MRGRFGFGLVLAACLVGPSTARPQSKTKGWPVNFQKPKDDELRKVLTPIQYEVTQKEGTEPPFRNEYADNHRPGIYVDVVSGEPLFSSADKFESGTGWPSFTRPLETGNVRPPPDYKAGLPRTEDPPVHTDSHLPPAFPTRPP